MTSTAHANPTAVLPHRRTPYATVQGKRRTGGSALAQAYGQLGDESPDVDMATLKAAFDVTQSLVAAGRVASGHDVSDGGVAVTVLEMAFAGLAGVKVDLPMADAPDAAAALFAEEPGLVLEVSAEDSGSIRSTYEDAGVPCSIIGATVDVQQVWRCVQHLCALGRQQVMTSTDTLAGAASLCGLCVRMPNTAHPPRICATHSFRGGAGRVAARVAECLAHMLHGHGNGIGHSLTKAIPWFACFTLVLQEFHTHMPAGPHQRRRLARRRGPDGGAARRLGVDVVRARAAAGGAGGDGGGAGGPALPGAAAVAHVVRAGVDRRHRAERGARRRAAR